MCYIIIALELTIPWYVLSLCESLSKSNTVIQNSYHDYAIKKNFKISCKGKNNDKKVLYCGK
jgi:hypothetical protein